MAKSFDEMSPDELQQLAQSFGQILQSEKSPSQPILEGVTAPTSGEADIPSDKSSDNPLPLPNGGLTGSDLDKQIEANPGPRATTGYNPSPDAVPSLFQMAGDAYKKHTADLTAPSSSDDEEDTSPDRTLASTPSAKPSAAPAAPQGPQFQAPSGPSPLDRLKDAQHRADMLTMLNQLGKAGAAIGGGIAGAGGGGIVAPVQSDTKPFDENIALAQQLPGRVVEELKMERLDPNSQTSQSARNFIKSSLKINVPDNVSAEQLKEQFPVIEKYLQSTENAKLRADAMKMHQQTLQANKEIALNERKDKSLLNEIDNSTKFRGDPAGAMASTTKLNIEKALDALKDPLTGQYYTDFNKIPPTKVDAFKGELSKIYSGSVGTNVTLAHSLSPSMQATMGKIQGYLDPNAGAMAGPQIQQTKEYLESIKKDVDHHLARKLLAKEHAIGTILGPERAKTFGQNVQEAWGFNPSQIIQDQANNTPQQAPGSMPGSSQQVPQGGPVRVKSLKTGQVKVLPADRAQMYLSHPDQFVEDKQ